MSKSVSDGTFEVLVTGGDTRPGLAVCRSLANHGISFIAIGAKPDMAFRSRLVPHTSRCPSSIDEPAVFIEFVREFVRKHDIKLLIPLPDSDVVALEQYRDRIEPATRLAMAASPSLRRAFDKRANLEIAQALKIPCAPQFELESVDQIPDMIEYLGFPIVLKSPGPTFDPNQPPLPFRVLYANDEGELRDYIDRYCGDGNYPLFQKRVGGTIHNVCCFAARGEVHAVHQYQSIRRYQGAGVLRKIGVLMPELERYARDMLGALEWDGPAHLGFFVSADRTKSWYMETNGRFWGSVQGSVNAGWDFPWWVYRYFRRGDTPTPAPIQIGSQTCWHRGDLEAMIQYLRGGEIPATGTTPGRFRAFLQYLSGFNPAIHPDVFRWSDPVPGIVDHWRFAQNVAAALKRRAR